jgi:hypothetical protein
LDTTILISPKMYYLQVNLFEIQTIAPESLPVGT